MNTKKNYYVPDIFAPKGIKETDEFAQNVARYVLGATNNYRAKMRAKYQNNRDIFNGKQSIEYLRDLLAIEENSTYLNIRFTPRPIAKKIIRLIVSGYLKDEEAVNATALSKHIADRKDTKRLQAKFRMENKELIQELSDLAGLPLTTSEEFTPNSEEELELYSAMNDKELEETLMQDTITYILNANDVEKLKNLALTELSVNNLFGIYETVDASGRPKLEPIKAEDAIVSQSFYEDFNDGSYFGRWVNMHVADVRRKFKLRPSQEKDFYKALCEMDYAKFAGNYGAYNETWNTPGERPYDKDTVRVLHIWWKCAKVFETVEGLKEGKPYFKYWDYKGYTPQEELEGIFQPKVDYKTPPTAYEGYFLNGGEFVLSWKEQENIPYEEKSQEVRSPFIFHMPENSGTMDIDSLVHMMKDSIETMDLAILKMKLVVSKMAPDGWAIDLDSLDAMDLGTGGVLQPLDVMEIARQTGDLFYRSKNEDGDSNEIPARPNVTSISDKLSSLISLYNFEAENIRSYLGMNEFRDGTANKSRTAAAFAQAQLEQSNMATEFLYRAWTRIMSRAVKNLGLRAWYALKFGQEDKGLLRYLGSNSIDFIKNQKDIIATAFDFEYSVVLTREEKMLLEQTMASAVAEGSLKTEDVILIRQVKNVQVALKYLNLLASKRRKESMEEAERNQQSAANYTAQAGVQVEQAKQETARMAADMEREKEKVRGENAIETEMTKGALAIMLQYAQSGQPLPEQYAPLVSFVLDAATNKIAKSNRITNREMRDMDAEEQMEAVQSQLNEAVANGEISEEELEAYEQ